MSGLSFLVVLCLLLVFSPHRLAFPPLPTVGITTVVPSVQPEDADVIALSLCAKFKSLTSRLLDASPDVDRSDAIQKLPGVLALLVRDVLAFSRVVRI